MAASSNRLAQSDVLRQYAICKDGKPRYHQKTVRRYFIQWRKKQDPPIPDRCDNPQCHFHTNFLIWIGKSLGLIMDHIDGYKNNNLPKNLRFLCPNCNSQLDTHAGKNKGRVEYEIDGAYTLRFLNGKKKSYNLQPFPANTKIFGSEVSLSVG